MWLPVVFALSIIALDQGTKYWALTTLTVGKQVPVLGEALQWLLVKNAGAAFSFASNATWVFTLISAAVALLILFNLYRLRALVWSIFAGLVLGGTLGNLADRLFREPSFGQGHVIDFVYTPWMMPAIYNVADIAVVIGMCLFVLLTLLGIDFEGKRKRTDAAQEQAQEGRSGATHDTGDDDSQPQNAAQSEE